MWLCDLMLYLFVEFGFIRQFLVEFMIVVVVLMQSGVYYCERMGEKEVVMKIYMLKGYI